MITIRHLSASSIKLFTSCVARWAQRYDPDHKLNEKALPLTKGTLIHGALELWKDPARNEMPTLDALQACFLEFARTQDNAESFEFYQAAWDALPAAYETLTTHPLLNRADMKVWGVEAEIKGWRGLASWSHPIFGFIDNVSVAQSRTGGSRDVELYIIDYKSGQPKSKDDLRSDPQAALYLLFGHAFLAPRLERQGYRVVKVEALWVYVEHNLVQAMSEMQFDLGLYAQWVDSISHQMVARAQEYNEAVKADNEATAKHAAKLAPGSLFVLSHKKRDAWMNKHATFNGECSQCVIKFDCAQYQRAFEKRAMIDVNDQTHVTWDMIFAEREMYAAAQKQGEERKKEIDRFARLYMEQNNLEFIPANGQEFFEVVRSDREVPSHIMAEIVGIDNFVKMASMSLQSLEKFITQTKAVDKNRATAMKAYLDHHTQKQPGARYVSSRKAKVGYEKAKPGNGEHVRR